MCLPKPVRTNLVSQPTPMIAAIWKTVSEGAPTRLVFSKFGLTKLATTV